MKLIMTRLFVLLCLTFLFAGTLNCFGSDSDDDEPSTSSGQADDDDADADDDDADNDANDDVDDDVNDDADDDADDDVDDDANDDVDDDVDDDADDDVDDDVDDDTVDDDTGDDDTLPIQYERAGGCGSGSCGEISIAVSSTGYLQIAFQYTHYHYRSCTAADMWLTSNETGSWESTVIEAGDCENIMEEGYWWSEELDHSESNALILDGEDSVYLGYSSNYESILEQDPDIWERNTFGKAKAQLPDSPIVTLDEDFGDEADYCFRQTGEGISVALDSAGTAHFAFGKCISFSPRVERVAYITLPGDGVEVLEAPDYHLYPYNKTSIMIDSAENVHILYPCNVAPYEHSMCHAEKIGGNWTIQQEFALGPYGLGVNAVMDDNDVIHAVYFIGVDRDLVVADNAGGVWNMETVATVVGGDLLSTSIVLDADGATHVTYYVAPVGPFKYATNKSGTWQSVTIDDERDYNGKRADMILDPGGVMHIVYYKSGLEHAFFPIY